jgi:cob(I)alamin adenosyltransferase
MSTGRGCIQVYTGDGKGKTTAALGLALRAAGWGMDVAVCQFLKGRESGERISASLLPGLSFHRLMETEIFIGEMSPAQYAAFREHARKEFHAFRRWVAACKASLVILDEIFAPLHAGILSEKELLALLEAKPPAAEWVLTGRGAPATVIARADLVTEMRPVKHYFMAGVPARRGIEY